MAASFPAQELHLSPHQVLRTSPLPHRRVNAVWAYGAHVASDHVSQAESACLAEGRDPLFKISGALPLDAHLRSVGYVEEAPTPVFATPTVEGAYPNHIVISDERDLESAIGYWMAFTGKPQERLALYVDSYRRCPGQIGVAFALDASQVAAVGMAHDYRNTTVISNLVTASYHRREGHGRAVTQALMKWGHDHETSVTALQVEAANEGAISLYQALGFEKAYDSWYLRKVRNHAAH